MCGAPCEAACRRARLDSAVSIRALKRFVTGRFGSESGKFAPLDAAILGIVDGTELDAEESS